MKNTAKTVTALMASGALVVTVAPVVQAVAAETPAEATDQTCAEATAQTTLGATQVLLANVQGVFAWDQGVSTSNAELSGNLYEGSRYLCGGTEGVDLASADAVGTVTDIVVKGDVANAFTANMADYNQKAPVQRVLACTCVGNPKDGRASANAEVGGFQLAALIEDAQPAADVNTITFTCEDGYEVSLPLDYVTQRYSIIVTQVNGETSQDAVGCANQLWLGRSSARTFARNIVAITFSSEEQVPDVPETIADEPNVGVLAGASA